MSNTDKMKKKKEFYDKLLLEIKKDSVKNASKVQPQEHEDWFKRFLVENGTQYAHKRDCGYFTRWLENSLHFSLRGFRKN